MAAERQGKRERAVGAKQFAKGRCASSILQWAGQVQTRQIAPTREDTLAS
jgi:hypothetical protein